MDIRKYGSENWGGLLVIGILGTIISFLLIWNPIFAGMSVIILVSLSFLFAGLFNILFSLQLRKLHKSSENIPADLIERYDALRKEIHEEWKG